MHYIEQLAATIVRYQNLCRGHLPNIVYLAHYPRFTQWFKSVLPLQLRECALSLILRQQDQLALCFH